MRDCLGASSEGWSAAHRRDLGPVAAEPATFAADHCPFRNPPMPRTLYDKIWDDHVVDQQPDGTCLLYIDRHLVHEVTSPQAFEGLRTSGRKVRAPEKTLAVVDHNIPTTDRTKPNPDPESAEQIRVMEENAKEFGIEYYDSFDPRQGICHIIGP